MCRARHCALPGTKPPFPSPIAAGRPDPLASFERVVHLAGDRRSRLVDPGDGGHINPASGYGPGRALRNDCVNYSELSGAVPAATSPQTLRVDFSLT
ncbi:alpha/beta hydrolase [Cupriavidus basilensis]